MKKYFALLPLLVVAYAATSQTNVDIVMNEDGHRVAVGFENTYYNSDEAVFTNAVLYAVDSACSVRKDAIVSCDYVARSLVFDMVVPSVPGSKQQNTYSVRVSVRVQDHMLAYNLSDMLRLPGRNALIKRPESIDRLTPDARHQSHIDILDDLSKALSARLDQMTSYIADRHTDTISHWNEIRRGEAVRDMNRDECLLALGKPSIINQRNGKEQWVYGNSHYLFFIGGTVSSVIK